MQTNKVKYIAPFISLIHGVESFKLLKEINKQAFKNSRVIKVLLQFHIASESTKFGLQVEEANDLLISSDFQNLKNIEITGVMGMASFINDKAQVRSEFSHLNTIFNQLKKCLNNFGLL
jgi:hypothetical protein